MFRQRPTLRCHPRREHVDTSLQFLVGADPWRGDHGTDGGDVDDLTRSAFPYMPGHRRPNKQGCLRLICSTWSSSVSVPPGTAQESLPSQRCSAECGWDRRRHRASAPVCVLGPPWRRRPGPPWTVFPSPPACGRLAEDHPAHVAQCRSNTERTTRIFQPKRFFRVVPLSAMSPQVSKEPLPHAAQVGREVPRRTFRITPAARVENPSMLATARRITGHLR